MRLRKGINRGGEVGERREREGVVKENGFHGGGGGDEVAVLRRGGGRVTLHELRAYVRRV